MYNEIELDMADTVMGVIKGDKQQETDTLSYTHTPVNEQNPNIGYRLHASNQAVEIYFMYEDRKLISKDFYLRDLTDGRNKRFLNYMKELHAYGEIVRSTNESSFQQLYEQGYWLRGMEDDKLKFDKQVAYGIQQYPIEVLVSFNKQEIDALIDCSNVMVGWSQSMKVDRKYKYSNMKQVLTQIEKEAECIWDEFEQIHELTQSIIDMFVTEQQKKGIKRQQMN